MVEIMAEPRSHVGGRPLRILIAEDEDFLRRFYEAVMEDQHFDIQLCSDGQEALEFLEADNDFDLILTDIGMPRLNGYRLLEYIRTLKLEIPAILASGYADQQKIRKLCAFQGIYYLQKPFSDDELLELIGKVSQR